MPINDNFIRILVASDIHLGYAEKIPLRAEDSFNSFDELLGIGKEKDVDLCILGGDLYHENKPTRSAQIKCVQILSKHVLGSDPVYIEYKSDPEVDFKHCNTKAVNYEDPNMNISLPVFSIHGNHDDPTGLGGYSCLDLLHESKHVNYFGKVDSLKEIVLTPILLKKNDVSIAIYGLSSVKDERLHRLFREKKIIFETPAEKNDWFYIFVLHQNRAKRGPTNYIPESFIPSFFHLVIWGHEHDCRIEPETSVKEFFISQPGSPVATSLCEGESIEKKVGILTINSRNEFRMDPVPLKTVRPLLFSTKTLTEFKTLNLEEKDDKRLQKSIERELTHEVEDMIQQAEGLLTGHPKQGKLPLIRLRIEYTDERQQLNPVRFGNAFVGRVANPSDILLFKRRVDRAPSDNTMNTDMLDRLPVDAGKTMDDYLSEYFNSADEKMKMGILSLKGLSSAVNCYINKSDSDAIAFVVKKQLQRRQEKLLTDYENLQSEDDEEIERVIDNIKDEVDEDKEAELASQELNAAGRTRKAVPEDIDQRTSFDSDNDDMDLDVAPAKKPATNGRARGSARNGTTAKKTNGRATVIDDSDEEQVFDKPAPARLQSPAKPARGGRGSRARGRGAAGGRGASSSARGKGQQSIMASFATQSQRATQNQTINSTRSTQRNKKQQFISDSDSD